MVCDLVIIDFDGLLDCTYPRFCSIINRAGQGAGLAS